MGINYTDFAITDLVTAATFNDKFDELDQAIKLNVYAKTAAPTSSDDSGDGYSVGSRWIDTTNDRIYVAVDVTLGAAIWVEVGMGQRFVSLPAMAFYIVSGAPAQGNLGSRAPTWRFDDSLGEIVGTSFPYQGWKSGATLSLDTFWAMESAMSGNVVIVTRGLAIADGEDASAADAVTSSLTVAVPGTAKLMKKSTFSLSMPYVLGDVIRLTFERQGGNGSDTATGDLHFLGMAVRFL